MTFIKSFQCNSAAELDRTVNSWLFNMQDTDYYRAQRNNIYDSSTKYRNIGFNIKSINRKYKEGKFVDGKHENDKYICNIVYELNGFEASLDFVLAQSTE